MPTSALATRWMGQQRLQVDVRINSSPRILASVFLREEQTTARCVLSQTETSLAPYSGILEGGIPSLLPFSWVILNSLIIFLPIGSIKHSPLLSQRGPPVSSLHEKSQVARRHPMEYAASSHGADEASPLPEPRGRLTTRAQARKQTWIQSSTRTRIQTKTKGTSDPAEDVELTVWLIPEKVELNLRLPLLLPCSSFLNGSELRVLPSVPILLRNHLSTKQWQS